MEDLIYVLLVVVWLIFSVANAKKKKQQQAAPTNLPKNPFEDILEEFLPKNPKVESQDYDLDYQVVSPVETSNPSPESLETLRPMGAYDAFTGEWKVDSFIEDYDSYFQQGSEIGSKEQNDENPIVEIKGAHPLRSRFNLRQAIVYQSILQRPDL